MESSSPFREEDLLARVDALRAERDELERALAVALREGRRSTWSWRRFLLGVALLPTAVVLSALLVGLFS